jgi:hypothetical protein
LVQIDRNVLHRDLLLAPGPIPLERFHLHRKRPGQLVECPFCAILLEDVVHMSEAAGEGHGGHVNCRHLGSHHGFNFVLRANAPHHRQHKVRSPFVGYFSLRTHIDQLGKQSVVEIEVRSAK